MTSRIQARVAAFAGLRSSALATGAAAAFIAFAAALGLGADPAPDRGGLGLRGTLAPHDLLMPQARLPAASKRA